MICKIVTLILIAILCVFAILYTTSIPTVYWSYTTDSCVKVVEKGIECDCSSIPEKFQKVWVK